jgi:alpha-ribazole phosphatase
MRRLFLIRHALTAWNLEGRVQGHSEVPLCDTGEAQARALTARFLGHDLRVYSSPLGRARQTAELAFPGREILEDERLKELNFGAFEGETLNERLAQPAWQHWAAAAFAEPAPGGESYRELRHRAVAWLETLPDEGDIAAVTHSGTIQMLLSHVLGVEHPRWRKRFYLAHTGVTVLREEDGEMFIERVNDTAHLDALQRACDEEPLSREP